MTKPDLQELAKQKLEERALARSDKMYLATEVLGYDFVPDCHQELFDQFIQYDTKKPWAEQSRITKRMILWPRGHFKSTAVIVDIIQAILNFPDIRILIMQGSLKTTKNLLKEIAAHFTGEASRSRLSELFSEFCGSKSALELSALSFTTPARQRKQLQQATVTCASPKAVKTGQHYDCAYFDDLVNDQNYRSIIRAIAEETVRAMERAAIDEEDDTKGAGLRREAKAARKFLTDFLRQIEITTRVEVPETANVVVDDDYVVACD